MSQHNHKSITVTVTDATKEALVVLAYRNNTTLQALLEVAIDILLDNPPTPDDMDYEL